MYQEQFKDFDKDLDSPPKRSLHLVRACLPHSGYLVQYTLTLFFNPFLPDFSKLEKFMLHKLKKCYKSYKIRTV
jgi:hypothetical protein